MIMIMIFLKKYLKKRIHIKIEELKKVLELLKLEILIYFVLKFFFNL